MLSQANFVQTKGEDYNYYEDDHKDGYTSHIKVILSHPNSNYLKEDTSIEVKNGLIYKRGSNESVPGFLAKPEKLTKIEIKDGKYHFYGDYHHTAPYDNGKHTWIINVLVVDKNWISLLNSK